MKTTNHFNQAHVFGRPMKVARKTTEKRTPYLEIQISCANPKLGDAVVYGHMYGEKECMEFEDFYKQTPAEKVRLSGFFNQYEKNGQLRWSFAFFRWQPWTDAEGNGDRAAFILVGDVREQGDDPNADYDRYLDLHLSRKGTEGNAPQEEDFRVYSDLASAFDGVEDSVKVQGYLIGGEGEFGEGSPPRPMVHIITIAGKDRRLYDKK